MRNAFGNGDFSNIKEPTPLEVNNKQLKIGYSRMYPQRTLQWMLKKSDL